jgi:hypothetical protein
MALSEELLEELRSQCEKFSNCDVVDAGTATKLVIRYATFIVAITMPWGVHEWYVEVREQGTDLEASDWYDYDGYELIHDKDVDHHMANDLRLFLDNMRTRPLRMRVTDQKKQRAALEWQIDDSWKPLVPGTGR